ncbi:conjugal transfer protein TraF [Pseudomaricurvus alcaniphilus]|uniref:conjugal transfer protein TraF n=1 Tax=Pseudomaricurvus alcaniphilus TaxID=1166482 RepID=UPI00140B10C8|nr:conjugal transfer protein TraF [Pseudomaricurvus alcaniphilus]NHN36477.1 conjugal transfer protein TraF [Pseudomaricurvus alcaniphilus]
MFVPRYIVLPISLFAFSLISQPSSALSFLSFDARSMAMGGAGVAEGNPGNAALFNPALLLPAEERLRKTRFFHSYGGARLIDRDDFIDRVRRIEDRDYEESIDATLARVRGQFKAATLSSAELRDLAGDVDQLLDDLESVTRRPLRGSASVGFSAGYVDQRFSYGLYARNYWVVGAEVNVPDLDAQRLRQLVALSDGAADVLEGLAEIETLVESLQLDVIEDLARQSVAEQRVVPELRDYADIAAIGAIIQLLTTAPMEAEQLLQRVSVDRLEQALVAQNAGMDLASLGLDDVDLRDYLRYQVPEDIDATLDYAGAEVTEVAFSIATNRLLFEQLTLGVSFKALDIDIIEFSQPLDDIHFGAYRHSANRQGHRRFNMDVGAVYALGEHYSAGVVVRNIIPFTLQSPRGTQVEFEPIVRVGLGYRSRHIKWALDYDVTTNEPLGFDPDKRYISAGVEWRLWKQNALRVGYRYNTVDHSKLPSIGLGLGFQQGHIDMAVTYSGSGEEYGLSLQAGLQF